MSTVDATLLLSALQLRGRMEGNAHAYYEAVIPDPRKKILRPSPCLLASSHRSGVCCGLQQSRGCADSGQAACSLPQQLPDLLAILLQGRQHSQGRSLSLNAHGIPWTYTSQSDSQQARAAMHILRCNACLQGGSGANSVYHQYRMAGGLTIRHTLQKGICQQSTTLSLLPNHCSCCHLPPCCCISTCFTALIICRPIAALNLDHQYLIASLFTVCPHNRLALAVTVPQLDSKEERGPCSQYELLLQAALWQPINYFTS